MTILAGLVAGLTLALVPVAPAGADPGDEGGTAALQQALDAATRGYVEAQAALDASRKRQVELVAQAAGVEAALAAKEKETASIVDDAYRNGRLAAVSAMLDDSGPQSFLRKATTMHVVAVRNDRKIRELKQLRGEVAAARERVDAEVRLQEQQVAAMAKTKQDAEAALAAVGGEAADGPQGGTESAQGAGARAQPAPRRADGSWPKESCGTDDPTTRGCITPRTLHALQQAKAAGFTRYVSCYRPGGPYEHPKGRACDFAAQPNGFGGVASGGDRSYGTNLATYFVRNANALGVLYVIWFKQIWLPSSGWRHYRGGHGDPSSDHTNHVHLSMY